ncbi:MAG: serine hydrolase [Marinoscillum sp.]
MNSLKAIVFSIIILSQISCKDQSSRPLSFDELESKKFLTEIYEAHPLPGLVAVIVSGDQTQLIVQGYAALKDSIPFTDQTMFFTGAFSELIVSSAILKLAEDEQLQLTDLVVDHIPYFQMQGAYDQVSVHHLLSHTSGISHFNPAWDIPTYDAGALSATTKSIIYQPLEFTPGTRVRRSPYNTDIAADLIQNFSGQSFEKSINDQFLVKIGMTHSTFDFNSFQNQDLAKPHQVSHWLTYDQKESDMYPYTRENVGSYGFHSTATDIATWISTVLEKPESTLFEKLYTMSEGHYKGYGWEVFQTERNLIYNNSWAIGGFSADLTLIPEKNLGVFVLANTMEDFNPSIISRQLLDFVQGGELPAIKPPIHIAMSQMMARGHCLEEVFNWYETQMHHADSPYEMNSTLIGQFGVNLLHRVDQPVDALKVFQFAVDQYPQSAQAYLNLAEGLLVNNEVEAAERALEKALTLDPSDHAYAQFLKERITVELEGRDST